MQFADLSLPDPISSYEVRRKYPYPERTISTLSMSSVGSFSDDAQIDGLDFRGHVSQKKRTSHPSPLRMSDISLGGSRYGRAARMI